MRREKPGLELVVADSMDRCRTGPGRELSAIVVVGEAVKMDKSMNGRVAE